MLVLRDTHREIKIITLKHKKMKILKKDLKNGTVKVRIESLDDLWTLSKIIEVDDVLFGTTERKIKLGDSSTDRNVKVVRKKMTLTVQIEKVEYEPALQTLRATGKITDGPEDIPRGDYHSFGLAIQDEITIKKEWLQFQLEKIDQAQHAADSLLICLFDREQSIIGTYSRQGFKKITSLAGTIAKKVDASQQTEDFYGEIAQTLSQSFSKINPKAVILSSADFFKDYVLKRLTETIAKKTKWIPTQDVNEQAIQQLVKSQEFLHLEVTKQVASQAVILEQILKEISADGKATYGFNPIKQAANMGAISDLLVANDVLLKAKENDTYSQLASTMQLVEQGQGNVFIIENESPLHKTVEGLGGMCALLRYSLEGFE